MVELPSWHSKGGGFSGTALGGSAALPSGTDPRTGQRAPTQEPAISKAKSGSARVFCLLPVLACLCRGFPGSGSLVLRPCPFGFLFVFVPPDVSFYWPRASRSSSQREGRRVSAGAPTQEPALSRYPFTYVEVVFKFAVAFVFLFFFVLRLCTTTLFFMSDYYCGDLFQL